MQHKPTRQSQPKRKRCKECKTLFSPRNTLQSACSPSCALKLVPKMVKKFTDAKRKEAKKVYRDNDLPIQKKAAQTAFNAYIRERDSHLGCVSCDKGPDWHGQWHAGHYKTVGARGDIRFNERNAHKQCSVCNNHLSGNLIQYRAELERRIGLPAVLELEQVGEPVRYRAADYKAIAVEYRAKLKSLKSNNH